jgi:riboflavin synthase
VFSGIVETCAPILTAQSTEQVLQIAVERPKTFDDLRIGDSIATDGVCLTIEGFSKESMTFALGPETLRITGWTGSNVLGRVVNLERSLRLSDRIHGHLVTGHVDAAGCVLELVRQGDTQQMMITFPPALAPFIWFKGSITVNGVSLTINQVGTDTFSVGLIPETLRRTNLGRLRMGDLVNLEVDNSARGLVRWAQLQEQGRGRRGEDTP